ncbi:MAG: alpha/beta fold hydrolase [Deltaproteobacteria bacterium]|nr:alpha/beta fold hydrolase [Deltaproteobacteria bacterium]
MDREKLASAALFPLDWALEKWLKGLDRTALLRPTADMVYMGLQKLILAVHKARNELDIQGLENIPKEGGIILASNHQSWLDAPLLGATCPRKIHFVAKSEFQYWPVVRHLVRLGESVFVNRGGDNAALESITEALQRGWAIAIYPEGTIPGEEEIPRRAVEPQTGLLPGHTGVVRLALKSGVPIIPVGVSGTGRALPPEIYPRLELVRLPGSTPIRIRYGEPISLKQYEDKEFTREMLRELTDGVMKKISSLVDHRSNFPPMEVPIPEPPKQENIGVLLLHGFTSHSSTVSGLVPHIEEAGLPYSMPILRGHGTRFEDLNGVTAKDWYVDAERALIDLWSQVDQVVVVGLSMGGLLALELAMRHPGKIAGLVTVGAALKFADPLARFSRRMASVVKYWESPTAFNDPSLAGTSKNYSSFPTETFASLYDYSREIIGRLNEVHVPIRIMQSKKDQVVAPVAANLLLEGVSSPKRELFWYQESGHEMMMDLEKEKVMADIMEFVCSFEKAKTS